MFPDFDSSVTTSETTDPQDPGKTALPVLLLLHPEARRVSLARAKTQVGRSRSRDVALVGQLVSRLHCTFEMRHDCVTLSDAGSRNGTFVNGQPAQDTELCVGDVIRIGDWVGVFARGLAEDDWTVQAMEPSLLAGPHSRSVLAQARQVAQTRMPVLLHGESGSGKECFARFLHHHSGRRGAFVGINCAAIPESLAEAELFGHRKGAYTGADRNRAGAFQRADGGTLLLDEVSDLPLAIQAKLLRVLEEGHVLPVGSSEPIEIDVRIVAAGQEPLSHLVEAKVVRGDLFARLNGVCLAVPPLRGRKEEILPLFLSAYREQAPQATPALAPEFVEQLLLYRWPLNVRELQHTARRIAVLHASEAELTARHVPEEWRERTAERSEVPCPSSAPPLSMLEDRLKARLTHRERQLEELRLALHRHAGNVSRAARALGISRGRAYRLLAGTEEIRDRPSD